MVIDFTIDSEYNFAIDANQGLCASICNDDIGYIQCKFFSVTYQRQRLQVFRGRVWSSDLHSNQTSRDHDGGVSLIRQ